MNFIPSCVLWPDLFCGRSLVEETGLFIGLVGLHLHHNAVVHLTAGPAEISVKKQRKNKKTNTKEKTKSQRTVFNCIPLVQLMDIDMAEDCWPLFDFYSVVDINYTSPTSKFAHLPMHGLYG